MHKLILLYFVFFLSSCALFKKAETKLFPYKNVDVETITQTPAPPKPAPVKTAEPNKEAKPNPAPKAPLEKPNITPMREFRAAWIASVANINWPSKPGLTSEEQQSEAIQLLDYLSTNNFNAVILQVRPQADALYVSSIEPWSYFLTGQQDKAPFPYYDPLKFWIDEAHKRGIELHAWLNPYRAHHTASKDISNKSIVKTNPERVYKLKQGFWWMDPSLKSTQDHTTNVVMDIVKRYDVDGIHFDDYFYPYPSYNGDKDFPDSKSWNEYVKNGGKLSKGDWRRQAVNTLIERIYSEIKAEKKYVKFGLSPFGIWRPGSPAEVSGFDQYEKLYADAKLWLNKGWIDYFTPQLYWPINKQGQSFPVLLEWWQSENKLQRHLWPGLNINNFKDNYANNKEVVDEISISRNLLPKSMGAVHWHVSFLTNNPSLTQTLKEGPYKNPALVPSSPWLNNKKPISPELKIQKQQDNALLQWSSKDSDTFKWIVYSKYGEIWEYQILNKNQTSTSLKLFQSDASGKKIPLKQVSISSIDRTGMESEPQPLAFD
jgi:uncharacterized lipoprotein YddW (UPF0748 family)